MIWAELEGKPFVLLFSEFLRFSVASDLWTESNQSVYSIFFLTRTVYLRGLFWICSILQLKSGLLRPGSDADLFMSRTQFEFGPTQINQSTPVDSDAELNQPFHSRS